MRILLTLDHPTTHQTQRFVRTKVFLKTAPSERDKLRKIESVYTERNDQINHLLELLVIAAHCGKANMRPNTRRKTTPYSRHGVIEGPFATNMIVCVFEPVQAHL